MKHHVINVAAAVLLFSGAAAAHDLSVAVSNDRGGVWLAPEMPSFSVAIADTLGAANSNSVLTVKVTDDKGLRTYLDKDFTPAIPAGRTMRLDLDTDIIHPGFYRLNISDDGNQIYSRVFGYEPENIVSLPDSRPDFDAFWQKAVAEAHSLGLDGVTISEVPGTEGHLRRQYLVSIPTTDSDTIDAYLLMPVAPGKYPVKITFNGYGGRPWQLDLDANPELIEFITSTRGQFLSEHRNRYGDWIRSGLQSPDTFYYRGAYQDVIRAIDYVASLPEVDLDRIYAEGGSQGGALTFIAAALDYRIAAIAPYIPFMSDFPDYLDMANWPVAGMIQEGDRLGMTRQQTLETVSYFDLKNFARRIQCPVLMGVGLQDFVCPPHINFAPYNLLPGNVVKEYVIYEDEQHAVGRPDWDNRVKAFFNLP